MIRFALQLELIRVPGITEDQVAIYLDRLTKWLNTMPESIGVVVKATNAIAVPNRYYGHVSIEGQAESAQPSTLFVGLQHVGLIKIHIAYRLAPRNNVPAGDWDTWVGVDNDPIITAAKFNAVLTALKYELRVHCLDAKYEKGFCDHLVTLGRMEAGYDLETMR